MLLFLISSAIAAQSYAPSDLDGSYTLTCESVEWTLSASISGVIGSSSGSWSISVPITADCDGIDVDALVEDVAAACLARRLPSASCEDLAQGVGEAADRFNEASLAPIPESIDLRVYNTSSRLNRLLGVYPMAGTARYADGSSRSITFLVNNNDGAVYGNFAAAGISLSDAVSGPHGACTTLGTASIQGDIDRGSPFTLDATTRTSASLVCLAGSGASAVAITLNLGYTAEMSGSR